ncbi:hypothetical protein [Hyphomonas sp.]|jgi:ElaB/YqjD/DUF883 family membrane-anchored ribosome-binding protein|uniref:glycine zipper domain-containing protein n=1 Tax=Hyphomonas sp. TaxID=87 RepID=UPI0025C6589D|nr:hypothetical protein [Hyphomonas sp.]
MASAQSATSTSKWANGKDHKSAAEGAVEQDFRDARETAARFSLAVRSSATHFGEHVQRRMAAQAARAAQKVHRARTKAQDRVRKRPLSAIGIAAAAGILVGILTRR